MEKNIQGIDFHLLDNIEMLRIKRNKVAVESKVRPATITALAEGSARSINLETLVQIIDALNELAQHFGEKRAYGIEDIISYVPVSKR